MGNNPKNYFKITLRKKMKFFTAALVATAANAIQLEAEAQSSHVSAALREIQWGIHDAKATVNAINGALGTGGDVIIDGLEETSLMLSQLFRKDGKIPTSLSTMKPHQWDTELTLVTQTDLPGVSLRNCEKIHELKKEALSSEGSRDVHIHSFCHKLLESK